MRDEISLRALTTDGARSSSSFSALFHRNLFFVLVAACLVGLIVWVHHFRVLCELDARATHIEGQNVIAVHQLARAHAARLAALDESRPAERAFALLSVVSGLGISSDTLQIDSVLGENSSATPVLTGEDLNNYCASDHAGEIMNQSRALSWVLGETLAYFFDASQLLSATPSIRPVPVAWLSSSFGVRRHPIFGTLLMHKGLDLAGYVGLTVVAPANGKVVFTGVRGGYGRVVVLDHGYGMQTHFAHLNRSLVKMGEYVRRGDSIAEMGSSGNSTGPHLHYEVRHRGQPLDPRRFILD